MQVISRVNFNDILINPIHNVPILSEKDIRIIIIEVILAYLEKKISLKTVAKVANLIKQYNKNVLSMNLKSDIEEIRSLSVIEDVLANILEDLQQDKDLIYGKQP